MRRSPRLLLGLALVACGGQAGADAKTQAAAEREAPAAQPASADARPAAPTPSADEASPPPSTPARADADARPDAAIIPVQKNMPEKTAQADAPATPPAATDDRPAQFADLEALCAALAHDYIDGTLTDYYRGLRMKTAFGDDLRRRGETSMHPGRILEAGRAALGDRPGDPAAPSCAPLFAELDDLE